jgi:signal peptidase I
VVFKLPRDNSTDYIKRIVGLPGDRIQVKGGQLFINDEPVKRERVDDFVDRDWRGNTVRIPRYRETLPNGVQHYTLDMVQNSDTDNTPVFTVPTDHYFAMGDNRDNSVDSRVPGGGVGYIPAENLVGRAEILFFSKPEDAGIWEVWNWRFSRFFDLIDCDDGLARGAGSQARSPFQGPPPADRGGDPSERQSAGAGPLALRPAGVPGRPGAWADRRVPPVRAFP